MIKQGRYMDLTPVGAELMSGDQLDQIVERRTYWLLSGIAITALLGFAIPWWLKGGHLAGGLCVLCASLIGMSVVRMLKDDGTAVRPHLRFVILTLYSLLALGAWLQGTVQAPALRWLSVLPFIALAAGRSWLGVTMALAFGAQAAVMAVYTPAYIAPLRSWMLPAPAAQALSATMGSVLIFVLFGWLTLRWRRSAHRILDRAREQARQGEQAKERFLAMISHEVRTPLNGIVGVAALLKKTRPDCAQHAQLVEALEVSANNLLHMLNDVLDWTKFDQHGIQIAALPFSLEGLARECTTLYTATGQSKGIEVRCTIDPTVPGRLLGDSLRLQQVLNNLLSNAVKFTDRGSVDLEVSHVMAGDVAHVEIVVQDSGPGIAADRIQDLFQPFQQLDQSVARRFGGTGLGLSIAQAIVNAMQGRIEVHSVAGRGSRFCVHLPLKLAEAKAPAETAGQSSLSVLVAEDNEINQWVLGEMLEASGAHASFVSSGPEALRLLEETTFDLLLTDYHMPGMDGLQTLARIRELERRQRRRRMPAVMISGDQLLDQDPRLADIDAVLTKPFLYDQLQSALELARESKAAAAAEPPSGHTAQAA